MTPVNGAPAAAEVVAPPPEAESEVDGFRRQLDYLVCRTDALESRVNEVVDFYDGKKHGSAGRNAGGGGRGGHARGAPDLMRQFGVIMREITSDKLAWPFLKPVDVKALQLDDYYKIISKPMDFSTVEKKMEGKDGTKYSSVQEIYSDVRLIFTNAMKYNDEQNEIHLMAKALLENFEEKWLHFLPKVESEEERKKESKDVVSNNTSREASIAELAKVTDEELNEINKQLEELQKMVVEKCRKMTAAEKRRLAAGLYQISSDDFDKVLEMVAQDNPGFQIKAEEVELDMDAQSETTLWRLKFFVREALERRANIASRKDENAKRKWVIFSALKTALKRIKREP